MRENSSIFRFIFWTISSPVKGRNIQKTTNHNLNRSVDLFFLVRNRQSVNPFFTSGTLLPKKITNNKMTPPEVNVIKLFTAVSSTFQNKLEHLSLADLSRQAYRWWVRLGAYPKVEHLVLHSGRLRPYLQTLDKAGKACLGQTL